MAHAPKTDRRSSAPSAAEAALPEPLLVARWPRNRKGEEARVYLKTYEGHALVDIRTWYPAGADFLPGKGFAATIANLPALLQAVTDANKKATELGLLRAAADREDTR